MPNIGAVINAHNRNIVEETAPLQRGSCNCERRYRDNCPLDNNCLSENVMYEVRITSTGRNRTEKVYKGITETSFKTRLANHEKDFNNHKYFDHSELSKEVWKIKNRGDQYLQFK